ncbi:hypothetical protein ACIPVK_03845 [Paeniglutamicibacter sp. MACA_103]|uniref:hypothetical protein n=1 Tax=Paeniglutamicibacter sp. MACA_103 TaxID=3377337 RepID=UPI0038930A39
MSDESPRIVTRFYRVVRIPIMIGRLPSGEKIIGGPYTAAQIVAVGFAAMLLYKTFPLWRTDNFLANIGLAVVLILIVGIIAGKMQKLDGNPMIHFDGLMGSLNARYVLKQGTYRGKPLKLDRPRRARAHRTLIDRRDSTWPFGLAVADQPSTAPAVQLDVAPTSFETQPPAKAPQIAASSAVKHLLAQAGHTN